MFRNIVGIKCFRLNVNGAAIMLRFVGANCGKRASVQVDAVLALWQMSSAIPVAARPVWQIIPILPPPAQPARQSRPRQLHLCRQQQSGHLQQPPEDEIWEQDADRPFHRSS